MPISERQTQTLISKYLLIEFFVEIFFLSFFFLDSGAGYSRVFQLNASNAENNPSSSPHVLSISGFQPLPFVWLDS